MAHQNRFFFPVIKLSISVALIYWILRGTELGEIWSAINAANLPLVFVAFLLHFVGFYISALRWRILLKTQGVKSSVPFLIQSYMVSAFFNNLLPSIVGGDAVRVYDSWRLGKNKANALAVVFIDRFLGLVALMLFALCGLLVVDQLSASLSLPLLPLWMGLGFLGMLLVIWTIFFPSGKILIWLQGIRLPGWKKLENILDKIVTTFLVFKGQKKALLSSLWLSILLQTNVVLCYFLLAEALNFDIPLANFFLIIPLAIFIMMLPISINGIGLRESVFVFFFSAFGVVKYQAIAFSWLAYGLVILQGLLGGIVYALRR